MNFKTHPEITDQTMRRILAREMRLIRRIAREQNGDANSEWACDYLNGFETALRRLCNVALVEELEREVVA
jgi:Uri superfamily endonuclease